MYLFVRLSTGRGLGGLPPTTLGMDDKQKKQMGEEKKKKTLLLSRKPMKNCSLFLPQIKDTPPPTAPKLTVTLTVTAFVRGPLRLGVHQVRGGEHASAGFIIRRGVGRGAAGNGNRIVLFISYEPTPFVHPVDIFFRVSTLSLDSMRLLGRRTHTVLGHLAMHVLVLFLSSSCPVD